MSFKINTRCPKLAGRGGTHKGLGLECIASLRLPRLCPTDTCGPVPRRRPPGPRFGRQSRDRETRVSPMPTGAPNYVRGPISLGRTVVPVLGSGILGCLPRRPLFNNLIFKNFFEVKKVCQECNSISCQSLSSTHGINTRQIPYERV